MTKTRGGVLLARIGAAQGLRGEVRVTSHTQDPASISEYGPLTDSAGRIFEILAVRPSGNVLIVRFAGVENREQAEALNGTDLYVDRSALPKIEDPDEFYLADLEGLAVQDAKGKIIGTVTNVHDFGASDILEIRRNGQRAELYAFTRDNFPHVDLEKGVIVLAAPASVETGERRSDK